MLHDFRDPTNTTAAREEARLWDAMTAAEKASRSGPRYAAWKRAHDAVVAQHVSDDFACYTPRDHLVMVAA